MRIQRSRLSLLAGLAAVAIRGSLPIAAAADALPPATVHKGAT